MFLAALARTLAQKADCLLIYGSTDHRAWEESQAYSNTWHWANREITKAFLGINNLESPTLVEGRVDALESQPIAVSDAGQRHAIWCRALSGLNVTDAYVATVRALIASR
jgi:hypothetical protein